MSPEVVHAPGGGGADSRSTSSSNDNRNTSNSNSALLIAVPRYAGSTSPVVESPGKGSNSNNNSGKSREVAHVSGGGNTASSFSSSGSNVDKGLLMGKSETS